MILNTQKTEVDAFLTINNDIYRIIKKLDENQAVKKLLIHTTTKPLQGPEITKSLIDAQISRVALLPYDDEEGSIINVTFVNGSVDLETNTTKATIAIDVFTPGNQWIINEGVRPLMVGHAINNIMKELEQTDGVKYRLTDILNAQLTDILLGYRFIYVAVIDD